MIDLPQVSIVTPAFNAAGFLDACVRSVVNQSLGAWELFLVDDASTDRTADVAREWARREERIQFLSFATRMGAAEARNLAMQYARGRYLAFLDADDLWLPDKLARQLAHLRWTDGAAVCGSYLIAEGEKIVKMLRVPAEMDRNALLKGCPIGCSTVLIDTKKVDVPAMRPFRRGQDWALWLDMAGRGCVFEGLPGEAVAIYRRQKRSLSRAKYRKAFDMWRIYRSTAGLGGGQAAAALARFGYYKLFTKRRLMYPPSGAWQSYLETCMLSDGPMPVGCSAAGTP